LYREAGTTNLSLRSIETMLMPYVSGSSNSFVLSHLSLFQDDLLGKEETDVMYTLIERMASDIANTGSDPSLSNFIKNHKDQKLFVFCSPRIKKFIEILLKKCGFDTVIMQVEDSYENVIHGLHSNKNIPELNLIAHYALLS